METITSKTKGVLPIEGQDLTNKVCVLKADILKPEYREPKFQLWKTTGGFGCSPSAMGTAVWSKALADEEQTRWERYNFIGIASEELIKELFPEYNLTVKP